jgi:hypothetical protein
LIGGNEPYDDYATVIADGVRNAWQERVHP